MAFSKMRQKTVQNKNDNEEQKVKLNDKSLFYKCKRNNSNQQSFNELEKVVENQNMLTPKFKTTFNNYVDEREELELNSDIEGNCRSFYSYWIFY